MIQQSESNMGLPNHPKGAKNGKLQMRLLLSGGSLRKRGRTTRNLHKDGQLAENRLNS